MAQLTPQQKKDAARRRNAAARRELSTADNAEAEESTRDEQVYRVPADRKRPQQDQPYRGTGYGGPAARPRFVALGSESIVIEYEGADWLVNPSALDDWEDVENALSETQPKSELQDVYDTIMRVFEGDRGRYSDLKEHLRDRYGYVSANLMLGFVDTVRTEAEKLGN